MHRFGSGREAGAGGEVGGGGKRTENRKNVLVHVRVIVSFYYFCGTTYAICRHLSHVLRYVRR